MFIVPDAPYLPRFEEYGPLSGGRWGGGTVCSGIVIIDGMECEEMTGGTVDCDGEITATFTWSGGGTPPSSVVVKEECTASYVGTSGSRNTTLTVTSSTTTSESGKRVTVVNNPGQSFHVHCTPTASGTGDMQPNGPRADVSYKATVYPLDISFGGAFNFGGTDWRILIGQELTAAVSLGGYDTGTTDPCGYVWSSGDATSAFGHWYGTRNASQPSNPVYFAKDESTMACHYRLPNDNVTVSCKLTIPGVSGVAQIEKVIKVKGPISYLETPVLGPVVKRQDPYLGYLALELWDAGTPPNLPAGGFRLTGSVDSPAGYPLATGSYWNFVQLIKWTRTRSLGDTVLGHPQNGLEGLDTTYGDDYVYEAYEYDLDSPTRCWTANLTETEQMQDTPASQLNALISDNVSASDEFKTYMMYLPPGENSVYVPLKVVMWNWHGHTAWDGASWSWPDQAGSAISAQQDFPDLPSWLRWINPSLDFVEQN